MGMAGYIDIYDYQEVLKNYKELYPDNNIHNDWWYLATITEELGGKEYIFDYADDQGIHKGAENSFWFEDDEAWKRCQKALSKTGIMRNVELWT